MAANESTRERIEKMSIILDHVNYVYGADTPLAVHALNDVCLKIPDGQFIGIIGHTGSGKSTLMQHMNGLIRATDGHIYFNGEDIYDKDYDMKKLRSKVGLVFQYPEHQLFENTVLADVCFGPMNQGLFMEQAEEEAKKALAHVGVKEENFTKSPFELSGGQKKRVAIAGVLAMNPKILILDEPTAVLTPQETEKLFNVLRKMRDDGKAIVIITHKMHEVESLSDRVAVLRNGQYIGSMLTKDTTVTEMTNMMVGHAVTLNIERPEPVNPKPRIEVEGLTVRNEEGIVKLKDVSFTANSGEILGIAGISGCGQKELLEAIAGLQVVETGTIHYVEDDGSKEMLIGKDPLKIAEMGVSLSFVPEDRLGMGLVGNMDLTDNMMLRSFRKGHTPFTNRKPSKQLAEDVVENLEVVTPGITTPVRRLSGGNVQKVLVGREIASAPTVLLTAYAVRGLDINSSYTIYDLINEQKKKGVAVIFVGEDLDVLMEMSDRIMVLCGGEVSGILDARKTDKNEVGMLMTRVGGKEHEGEE